MHISAYLPLTAAGIFTLALAGTALGNDELMKLADDPKNWPMPTGDYANSRFSDLNAITQDNVKDLPVKWTVSTGVLSGHTGDTLVVADLPSVPPAVDRQS